MSVVQGALIISLPPPLEDPLQVGVVPIMLQVASAAHLTLLSFPLTQVILVQLRPFWSQGQLGCVVLESQGVPVFMPEPPGVPDPPGFWGPMAPFLMAAPASLPEPFWASAAQAATRRAEPSTRQGQR